jgi:hypothetical protein
VCTGKHKLGKYFSFTLRGILVPEPSVSETELAIDKLKSHKSPGIDQIPTELIKAGGRTVHCDIHKLNISICNKGEMPEEREREREGERERESSLSRAVWSLFHFGLVCLDFCLVTIEG